MTLAITILARFRGLPLSAQVPAAENDINAVPTVTYVPRMLRSVNEVFSEQPTCRFEPGMYAPEDATCAGEWLVWTISHVPMMLPLSSPVCIDAYKAGDVLRVLPCSSLHHFHKRCVDE